MVRLRYMNTETGLVTKPLLMGNDFVTVELDVTTTTATVLGSERNVLHTVTSSDVPSLKKLVKTLLKENGALFADEVRAKKTMIPSSTPLSTITEDDVLEDIAV